MLSFKANGYDGTGRTPRPQQADALEWLEVVWNQAQVFAIMMPVGVGKTYVARSIQRLFPHTRCMTYSNSLVQQFKDDYPNVSVYMGVSNYKTKEEYKLARWKAEDPDNDLITNPMALYYLKSSSQDYTDSDVVVLDEADAIIGLLNNLVVKKFPITRHEMYRKGLTNPDNLANLFTERIAKWREELKAKYTSTRTKFSTIAKLESKIEKYEVITKALRLEPERMSITITKSEKGGNYFAFVRPVRLPSFIFKEVFGGAKVVMLSATIFHSDVLEALPASKIRRLEVDSPIPVDRRKVIFSPIHPDNWYPVPHQMLADKIDKVLNKYEHLRPALIHATYSDALEISRLMSTPCLVYNSKEEKKGVVDKWLKEGGVLIGPGLSIGLDLKDDLCRLNIIPKIQYPNTKDTYVQKKRAINKMWYPLQAVKQVIQALGRSTRNENDYSLGVILDNRWSSLRSQTKDYIPKFFHEQVEYNVTEI